jgi:hypothetical protein
MGTPVFLILHSHSEFLNSAGRNDKPLHAIALPATSSSNDTTTSV